jgi:thioredoxin reductase (NADPH)
MMNVHAHVETQDGADLPVILIADQDSDALTKVEHALVRRFGADFGVMAASSSSLALELLRELAEAGREVALVGAALGMPDIAGPDLLDQVHAIHPGAGRALIIEMRDAGGCAPVQLAAARGQMDFTLLGGWESPEEWLYPQVQEALTAWSKAHRPQHEHVRIVGEQWSPRSHQLRDVLTRNMVPFGFYDAATEAGQHLLAEHGLVGAALPVIILFDGRAIAEPTDAQLAKILGVPTQPDPGVYDVAILGAGPAGLAAAVYAASEGLQTVVIEPYALGGQAGSSSMIRNYPGFPRGISGGELTYRAYEQALLLGARFVFACRATGLSARGSERVVTLSNGSEIISRSVVIATGVSYRRLNISALDRLVGMGVFYGAAATEAPAVTGERVCVVGGANSAGQAALHLAKYAAHVDILVRGASLISSMSDYLLREIDASPNIEVRTRTRIADAVGDHHLEALMLEDVDSGAREELGAAAVFIMIGAEPKTEWLADALQRDAGGYVQTGDDVSAGTWSANRPRMPLETSLPGVFAIGDVRSGSVKRVVSAVGDGGVVIGLVHRYLAESALVMQPDQAVVMSRSA